MKKFLKISGITVLSIIVLLLVLPFAFKNQIKALAQQEIDKNIDAKVRFSGVHLSFIRNFPNVSAGLDGLMVIGNGEFSKDTLANIERFRAVVDIMSIINGKTYEINKIIVEKPIIHALVHTNGKTNWDIFLSDSTQTRKDSVKPSAFSMKLQEYKLQNADIIYNDETLPMKATIKNLTHSGTGNFTENIYDLITSSEADEVVVNYAGVRYLNKNALRAKVGLNINNKESVYKFLENEIFLNDLPLKFSGTITLPDSNQTILDLVFSCPKAEVKQLFSLIPAVYTKDYKSLKSEGSLNFSGIIKGTYSENLYPSFEVKLNVGNGKIQYPSLPSALTAINIDMDIKNPAGKDFNQIAFNIE